MKFLRLIPLFVLLVTVVSLMPSAYASINFVSKSNSSRVILPVLAAGEAFAGFRLAWGSLGSGSGQFVDPVGVAVDSSGNVYVSDQNNNRVEKFTSTGTFRLQWPCSSGACTPGSGKGEFNEPTGLAFDSHGNMYVTDLINNRIELFGLG